MRRIVKFLAVAWCLVLAAALAMSPYGLPGVQEVRASNEEVLTRQRNIESLVRAAESKVLQVVQEVNDHRDFDVFYGDLENIGRVFNSAAGVSVQDVREVFPMQEFRVGDPVVEGADSRIAGVEYTLVVDDVWNALGIIEHMELPVHSVVIEMPNQIVLTFLTGGDL